VRKYLILPGAAVGIVLTLAVVLPNASAAVDSSQRDRLLAALDRIRANCVDALDQSELVTAAINGMTGVLESESIYIDAKDFRNMRINHPFVGLGLQIKIIRDEGSVKIVAPIDDSPAAKAGVKVNDVITHNRRRRRAGDGNAPPCAHVGHGRHLSLMRASWY
jgi:carboxyl-terminal processing protease